MPKPSYTPAEALNSLMKQLSTREMCTRDVIQLLNRWGVDKQEHEAILTKLHNDEFLDEGRYARAFVRDKIRFDHWGIQKITYTLKMKGLDGSVIRDATSEVNRSEYRTMVFRELEKKRRTITGTPREIFGKVARFGTSRGYETDLIMDFLGDSGDDG
jgi:regulatory protein